MNEHDDNPYRAQRLENLERLESLGYPPYGGAFERTGSIAGIRRDFAEDRLVRAAGRITGIRGMGKTLFVDLNDGTDRLQLFVGRNDVAAAGFDAFKTLDVGDLIGVEGALFTTRMGEPTLRVAQWTLLAKALRPLPEKWHGLRDTEACYRQRYLDLIANPETRTRFEQRAAMIREIRAFLQAREFLEVETPMMQPQAGGAAARPFMTHYEALHADMALRIAPELYLKRLLVGGFDRVFELNRNFRNEGLDRTHNPEFTMLEVYEAFGDLATMKSLIETMILHVADTVFQTRQPGQDAEAVDLSPPWRTVTYRELVEAEMGADWYALAPAAARARAEATGLEIAPDWDLAEMTHEIYEKRIERQLRNPTFVTRLPASRIPLARPCEDDPACADVFELVIRGQEVAPAYTELNDPREQRRRFAIQAGDDNDRMDEDFLTAMEYGMPPAGGMGVGIDRLVMILSGADSIRDVILFPQLKLRRHPDSAPAAGDNDDT